MLALLLQIDHTPDIVTEQRSQQPMFAQCELSRSTEGQDVVANPSGEDAVNGLISPRPFNISAVLTGSTVAKHLAQSWAGCKLPDLITE
jgi:hypothetical protein